MHFFKPLRRKIGMVTLVLACAFTALWVRSLTRHEVVDCCGHSLRCLVESFFSEIHLVLHRPPRFEVNSPYPYLHLFSNKKDTSSAYYRDENGQESFQPMRNIKYEWRIDFVGLHASKYKTRLGDVPKFRCIAPYWTIVVPLTLFSAWLLFSRPRAKIVKSVQLSTIQSVST